MKLFFRNIHLYLSLAAGLVIMSCCFSGAILVFEKELQEGLNKERYFVQERGLHLPLQQLIDNVKEKNPTATIASVKVYPNAARSVEIGLSLADNAADKKQGKSPDKGIENRRGEPAAAKDTITSKMDGTGGEQTSKNKQSSVVSGPARATHTAFVNPYTGNVLDLYNYRKTFYFKMFSLHRWLLGNDSSIGKTITGVATFIFLFILITGIILWWPRNKAILKQRLKIKTDASFKRLNHDLHIVLGFYSAIFLFIFAFTALAWSFKWFNEGIYTVTNSSMKPSEPPKSVYQAGKKTISYDSAFIALSNAVRDVQFYVLRAPADSAAIFSATVLPLGAHESASDSYYIDQYSGQVIGNLKFQDRNLGQRIRSTFKPVHVGSIYGLPSKIIAFIVCILGVTFPITGTIMWINRLRKKKQKVLSKKGAVLVADDYED
jgi:uncharacterized iron-regulated membrane protein